MAKVDEGDINDSNYVSGADDNFLAPVQESNQVPATCTSQHIGVSQNSLKSLLSEQLKPFIENAGDNNQTCTGPIAMEEPRPPQEEAGARAHRVGD